MVYILNVKDSMGTWHGIPAIKGAKGDKGDDGIGVPAGGNTRQVLRKRSNTDYDFEWSTDQGLPTGGTTGQILKKKSGTDYDVEWSTGEVSVTFDSISGDPMSNANLASKFNSKVNAVSSPTANNVAVLTSDGQIADGGKAVADFELTARKKTSWASSPSETNYPCEKLVKDSLDAKADIISTATENNFVAFDTNGNIKDSSKKASDFADRVSGATNGNFAGLDANGNLTDSGNKASDFGTIGQIGQLGNAIGMKGWNQFVNLQNGSFINTITDTRNTLHFNIIFANSDFSSIQVVYNQDVSAPTTIENIVTAESNKTKLYIKHNGQTTDIAVYNSDVIVAGHKYYININVTGTNPSVVGGMILNNVMCIDLTAIFGAGNEPTTVAEFRAMFPASYYPYCQGGFADLLWENASPSSAFAGQTVSIESISKYKYFGIIIRDNKDSTSLSTIQIILNKYAATSYICYTNPTEGNSRRDVVVWSDAIVFGNCKKQTSTDNDWMIPYQIYGIR